jgi:hypothetical protein
MTRQVVGVVAPFNVHPPFGERLLCPDDRLGECSILMLEVGAHQCDLTRGPFSSTNTPNWRLSLPPHAQRKQLPTRAGRCGPHHLVATPPCPERELAAEADARVSDAGVVHVKHPLKNAKEHR